LLPLAAVLCAQAPEFDVASVRPRGPEDRGPAMAACAPSGRFLSQGPIKELLLWAYKIKPFQLIGVPSWDPTVMYDNSGLYQIEARAAGPVSEDVCRLMALRLMADRFKMATHREPRQTAAWALTIARDGPKMRPSDNDGLSNKVVLNGRPMGTLPGAKTPGWSMETLADFLRLALPEPVVDRTGLEGEYRINLDFSTAPDPAPDAAPDIRSALRQQLGLQLDAVKVPIDYIVIDHIEKPDPN
jgi:uncharacterized protein (TIGR03435 family)